MTHWHFECFESLFLYYFQWTTTSALTLRGHTQQSRTCANGSRDISEVVLLRQEEWLLGLEQLIPLELTSLGHLPTSDEFLHNVQQKSCHACYLLHTHFRFLFNRPTFPEWIQVRLGYSSLGRSPKVNSWKLLWQNILPCLGSSSLSWKWRELTAATFILGGLFTH